MRINRFLSQSGIASRRKVEELVKQGRVFVNSKIISDLSTTVDPQKDKITVDGKTVKLPQQKIYLMLNKPKGYVTTAKDTHNRPTVFDLLSHFPGKGKVEEEMLRLFTVGRLDMNSRGLLLLTNDGDWAFKLTHPRYKVPKTYEVVVSGGPDDKSIEKLRQGVVLEDGKTQPAKITKIGKNNFEIVIKEGRKRQVRRMFKYVGYEVIDLKRTRFGDYELGDLKEGQLRAVRVKSQEPSEKISNK